MTRIFAAAIAFCLASAPALAQQQGQPQQLQNIEKSQKGDWTLECGTAPQNNQRICQMSQIVKNPKDGKAIMQAAVLKPPGDRPAIMRLVAPLGVWLRPGIGLSIDGGAPTTVGFDFCLREGCIAQIPLSPALVNGLKRGSSATLIIQNIRRQKLDLTVSLKGFTAGHDSL